MHSANAQRRKLPQRQQAPEENSAPEPYNFEYTGDYSSRQETKDANGRVVGFYTLMGDDGRERRVEYEADENGFRAKIVTNEFGTKESNPADAQYIVSPPSPDQVRQAEEGTQRAQAARRSKRLSSSSSVSSPLRRSSPKKRRNRY